MKDNTMIAVGLILMVVVPALFTAAIVNCVMSPGTFAFLGIGTLVCMICGAFTVAYVAQKRP